MEHREAIRLIDAAAQGSLSPAEQEALQRHLAGCADCRLYARLDTDLRRALHARYPESGADSRAIASALGTIQTRNRRQIAMKSIFRTAAWTSLAALFVLAITWSIRFLLPQPVTTIQITGAALETPVKTPVPPTAAVTPLTTAEVTQPPALLEDESSLLFPQLQFKLDAPLPAAPETVNVFVQELPQTVSLDALHQMAARLGMDAPIYQRPGEGPELVYVVSDGYNLLTFPYGSAEVFLYTADYANILSNHAAPLPLEQIFDAAQLFLSGAGLDEAGLQALPLLNQPNGVGLVRTLDERPVIFGVGYTAGYNLEVALGADGKLRQLIYAPLRVQPAGEFPILSAEEAWQAFLSGAAANRMRYGISDVARADSPGSLQSWLPEYPTAQLVHVYGYVSVMQPAEPGGAPQAHINNYLVAGANAASFASQASPYDFWHTWGQFLPDEQGRLAFHAEGWEVSPIAEQYAQGTTRRSGERLWLASEDGEFELLGAPADVPDGVFAEARGVATTPGVLDWFFLQTGEYVSPGYNSVDACLGGGGGGGGNDFGGGMFQRVSLLGGGVEPTPTPGVMSAPFAQGDTLEGISGTMAVRDFVSEVGVSQLDMFFTGDPQGSFTDFWAVHLVGDAVQGLAELNGLPLRIWGQVSGLEDDGWPIVELERFEEIYPGLRFQAWLGTWQQVTVEGQDVIILTTLEGEQYVLNHGLSAQVGREGDRVVIEGLLYPGDTLGGYPRITEVSAGSANDLADLSGYEITAGRPSVFDENTSEAAQVAALRGVATVETVELVYATSSLAACRGMGLTESDPELAPWMYVQPVWRFRGSLDDGKTFEIQVQALEEGYLK